MTPSNRIDALTDALLHYSRKMRQNLAKLLVHRHHRAEDLHAAATKELQTITVPTEQGRSAISVEEIRSWMDQTDNPQLPHEATIVDSSESEAYALKLTAYYELRLDRELLVAEKGHPRWEEHSLMYQTAIAKQRERLKRTHLFRVHTMCVDRWLLISLKQKYADGQAIAKLLISQIKTSTSRLKKAVTSFNLEMEKLAAGSTASSHQPLSFSVACDVTADVWRCLETAHPNHPSNLPTHLKRQWVDIVHKLDRSTEELAQLKIEMHSMFRFLFDQEKYIKSLLEVDGISKGRMCLLKGKHADTLLQIHYCYSIFHPRFIDLSHFTLPTMVYNLPTSAVSEEELDQNEICEMLVNFMGVVSSDDED